MTQAKEVMTLNKKVQKETLTPHRLTLAMLINEFFKLRESGMFFLHLQ